MKKFLILISLFMFTGCAAGLNINTNESVFLAGTDSSISLYNLNKEEALKVPRGSKVFVKGKEDDYLLIKYDNKEYYVKNDNIVKDKVDVVKEEFMYVRTSATVTFDSTILGLVEKGDKLEILGYDSITDSGVVNNYKIKFNDKEAMIAGKYLVFDEKDSLKNYEEEGSFLTHLKRGNTLGGGSAANLDFYPREKVSFSDNIMPDEVRSLYINANAVKSIDKYIAFALENNINALVIDIKDNTMPGYKSEVMKKYSKTSYDRAISSFDNYKSYIKKAKDNGLYVIGRITVFKDSYLVMDHPEIAIMNTVTNEPLVHNGSKWPTAYNRLVWEYNVALAKEAITEMDFNEIQFDYVRFPDGLNGLERRGEINLRNEYSEDKAVAIQRFLMYAADEIHSLNTYISADVFAECAHPYVTGYGQYFGAISNVVDVISPMPYPDHFNKYEYDFDEVVWTVPYKLLKAWGEYVVRRQSEIPTPAKVRSWFQAYDTIRSPYIVYDANMVDEQIKAFYESGMDTGYMPWNASSSLERYEKYIEVFKKNYKGE